LGPIFCIATSVLPGARPNRQHERTPRSHNHDRRQQSRSGNTFDNSKKSLPHFTKTLVSGFRLQSRSQHQSPSRCPLKPTLPQKPPVVEMKIKLRAMAMVITIELALIALTPAERGLGRGCTVGRGRGVGVCLGG